MTPRTGSGRRTTRGEKSTTPRLHQHPQGSTPALHHHPQTSTEAVVHNDNASCVVERKARDVPVRATTTREVPVPSPEALRPLAKVLVSIAVELSAARRDPLGASCPGSVRGLRMEECRGRFTGRLDGRFCRQCGATPETTTPSRAKAHVKAPAPPPVIDSDCMGDN